MTVVIEEAGAFCGIVGLDPIDPLNRSAPIGYWLRRNAQGRGLVTRSVRSLVSYGFVELGLNRIRLLAAVGNTRSRSVARRLGFSEEGVLRQAERHAGRYVDLVSHSILRSDPVPPQSDF